MKNIKIIVWKKRTYLRNEVDNDFTCPARFIKQLLVMLTGVGSVAQARIFMINWLSSVQEYLICVSRSPGYPSLFLELAWVITCTVKNLRINRRGKTLSNIFPYHVLLEYVRIPINVIERDETTVVMARAVFVVDSQRVVLVVNLHFAHRNFIRDSADRAPYVPVLQISWLYFHELLRTIVIDGWTDLDRKILLTLHVVES